MRWRWEGGRVTTPLELRGASMPMGAVMSFMVFGPMIDVKNVILMASSFTKKFMIKLLIVTFAVSFVTVYVAFSLGLGALLS